MTPTYKLTESTHAQQYWVRMIARHCADRVAFDQTPGVSREGMIDLLLSNVDSRVDAAFRAMSTVEPSLALNHIEIAIGMLLRTASILRREEARIR